MEMRPSTASVHILLLKDALSKEPFLPVALCTLGFHEPPNGLPKKQGFCHLSPRREDVSHSKSIDNTLLVPEPETQKVV